MREKFKPYKTLINDVRRKARANGIKIRFTNKRVFEFDDEGSCAGYFCSETKTLAVSLYGEDEKWLSLLVHESCHMDQYLDDPVFWAKCAPGHAEFFYWLEGKRIVIRERLEEYVQDAIRLEKNCEVRACRKILKYKLPINLDDYIKQANVYIYAYLYFLEQKVWLPRIYDTDAHLVAPKRFKTQYSKIPTRLHRKFKAIHKSMAKEAITNRETQND